MKIRRGLHVPKQLDAEYKAMGELYGVSVPYVILLAMKLCDKRRIKEVLELSLEDR